MTQLTADLASACLDGTDHVEASPPLVHLDIFFDLAPELVEVARALSQPTHPDHATTTTWWESRPGAATSPTA